MIKIGVKKTYIVVDAFELDKTISAYFRAKHGFPEDVKHDFVRSTESRNDTSHIIEVEGLESPLSDYQVDAVRQMLQNRNFDDISTNDILDYLAYIGEIEPGEYLVTVCW